MSFSDSESKKYGDPPTMEAWTMALTNLPSVEAFLLRRHAIGSLKNDPRRQESVNVAERILRERGISRAGSKLLQSDTMGQ